MFHCTAQAPLAPRLILTEGVTEREHEFPGWVNWAWLRFLAKRYRDGRPHARSQLRRDVMRRMQERIAARLDAPYREALRR